MKIIKLNHNKRLKGNKDMVSMFSSSAPDLPTPPSVEDTEAEARKDTRDTSKKRKAQDTLLTSGVEEETVKKSILLG